MEISSSYSKTASIRFSSLDRALFLNGSTLCHVCIESFDQPEMRACVCRSSCCGNTTLEQWLRGVVAERQRSKEWLRGVRESAPCLRLGVEGCPETDPDILANPAGWTAWPDGGQSGDGCVDVASEGVTITDRRSAVF